MESLKDYALTAEAARILGVSQNTVRAWARDGKLPFGRNPANGYRLFLRSDLQKVLMAAGQARSSGVLRSDRQANQKMSRETTVLYAKKEGCNVQEVGSSGAELIGRQADLRR